MSALALGLVVLALTAVLAPLARRRLIHERNKSLTMLERAARRAAESVRQLALAMADMRLGIQPEYDARHRRD